MSEKRYDLKNVEADGMLAVCREVDTATGEIAVYPVDMKIDENAVTSLQLRVQFSRELRIFMTSAAHFLGFEDVITSVLKKQVVTREDITRVGGMVEL